jgi:hypothetical protein
MNLPNINFNQKNKVIFDTDLMTPENTTDPFQVLKDSFEKYIVQSPVEHGSIGIQIIYLKDGRDREPTMMFLMKRGYQQDQINQKLRVRAKKKYITSETIKKSSNINNEQINKTIQILKKQHRILEITLCEVYNDDENARRKNKRNRRGTEHYYPYTIPIKVFYRNLEGFEGQTATQERMEYIKNMYDSQSRQLGISLQEFKRRYRENPQQIKRELRQIQTERMRLIQIEQQRLHEEDAQREDQQSIAIQQQARAQRDNPEAQRQLLESWTIRDDEDYRPTPHTPDPLIVNNSDAILSKPLTSYVWPGMCQICLDSNTDGLCRVNCNAGHIFHCDCINGYRDTYTVFGWNNKCPVCRTDITEMAKVSSDIASKLPSSFGKTNKFRSDLNYLLKL